ncbi:hypothetical protein VCHA53O466_140134 [Vibrio chagasii]|nr:hypothetical protein VCHA53O466_140134 [Vibrio chagasii]
MFNFNAVTGIFWDGLDERWSDGIKRNQWWASANIRNKPNGMSTREHSKALSLYDALIHNGGCEVCLSTTNLDDDLDIDSVIANGSIMGTTNSVLNEVLFLEMQTSNCHENAATVKAERPEFHLCTGFYMSSEGMWREHSWLLTPDKGNIIETSSVQCAYFGVIVD